MTSTWTDPTAVAYNVKMSAAEDLLRVNNLKFLHDTRLEKVLAAAKQADFTSTDETTMLTYAVLGGTLGTGLGYYELGVRILVSVAAGSDRTLTAKFKYGATTLVTMAILHSATYTDRPRLEWYSLHPDGDAAKQYGFGMAIDRSGVNYPQCYPATEASGGDLNLTYTWQWSGAGGPAKLLAAKLVWIPTP